MVRLEPRTRAAARGWSDLTIRNLWAELADRPDLGTKWSIDIETLSTTLRDLPYAALVALWDAVERFWASDVQPTETGWLRPVVAVVGSAHVREKKKNP